MIVGYFQNRYCCDSRPIQSAIFFVRDGVVGGFKQPVGMIEIDCQPAFKVAGQLVASRPGQSPHHLQVRCRRQLVQSAAEQLASPLAPFPLGTRDCLRVLAELRLTKIYVHRFAIATVLFTYLVTRFLEPLVSNILHVEHRAFELVFGAADLAGFIRRHHAGCTAIVRTGRCSHPRSHR